MYKDLGSMDCTKGVRVDISYGVICTTRIASNTHPLPFTVYCKYMLSSNDTLQNNGSNLSLTAACVAVGVLSVFVLHLSPIPFLRLFPS